MTGLAILGLIVGAIALIDLAAVRVGADTRIDFEGHRHEGYLA